MKNWVKGGIIGSILLLLVVILWWIYASTELGCVLEPIQSINVGGAECYFKDYFSIWNLLYLVIPIVIGFVIGAVIGLFIDMFKSKTISK